MMFFKDNSIVYTPIQFVQYTVAEVRGVMFSCNWADKGPAGFDTYNSISSQNNHFLNFYVKVSVGTSRAGLIWYTYGLVPDNSTGNNNNTGISTSGAMCRQLHCKKCALAMQFENKQQRVLLIISGKQI